MFGMTKEELELEIDMLLTNIRVLIGLGHDVNEPIKKLTEYQSKLLSLTHSEGNTNQEE
jgi:hypothetical protein